MKHIICTALLVLCSLLASAQWLEITDVSISSTTTEQGGPVYAISYVLQGDDLSVDHPAYVFIRYSVDKGNSWHLVDKDFITGEGIGIIERPGKKEMLLWGSGETGIENPEICVRGIQMARVPAGRFIMRSFPAGGKDPSKTERPDTNLPEFYMAINETTISMYADFLNETGKSGGGWNDRMSNEMRCGIIRTGDMGDYTYSVIEGRDNYPVSYVSWYDAIHFLQWCGLTLPTEAMFEKAFVGGLYLGGDATESTPNEMPERKFPWGNEDPGQGGIFRCNFTGEEDGYAGLAPVGTFSTFSSPYGINDLAGNVSEWTRDWYTTMYHIGLDGFRMVRGGSWLADSFACDAISGATQFPIKESSIMGFRCAKLK